MKPTPRCPACGETVSLVCHGKRYPVYPLGCVVILAFPLAMFHQASSPVDYECTACGRKFGVRDSVARFCVGVIVLLVLWTLAAVILAVFAVSG